MEQEFAEGIDSWETMMFLYNSALKEVNTKLEILNDEFVHIHNYNPIEYIKSRIKTPESIVKKLKKGGYESTIENMVTYVKDIAGIRIVWRAYLPQSKKYIIILYYVKPARIRLHLTGHKLLSLSCSDGKLLVFDAHTSPRLDR